MERVGIISKTTTHKGEQMIPKGYKHTELGVLPEDWEVVRVGEVTECLDHKRIPLNESQRAKCKKIFPYYGASGMIDYVDDYIFDEKLVLLGEDGANIIERSTRLAFCVEGKIWVNNHAHVLRPKGINQYFLAEILESLKYDKYNTGTAQPKLNQKIVSQIPIPLPPLAEQEKIAEILSAWDTQIQNFETLITEKQALKKGLCQTLLTVKTRLKGFSGDWEVVRLGDILEYEQPTKYLVSNTKYNNSYTTPVLTAGKTFILGYTDEVEGIYTKLPIILFDDFTTASQYVDFPFKVKSSACKILKLKKTEFNLRVVFEVMQRLNFVADDHKRYWISEYQNQEIFLPNAKEQRGIAEILSEADNEITLLEQKLESLKSQKKGLMQNLLTGRTRIKK